MEIFKLVGSVFVDTDEANKSLSKTDEKADSLGQKFANGAKTAGKWAVGIGTAAVAVGTSMFKVANDAAGATDEIDKMSQRLGVSRQAYQELDFVLSQSGVNINSFQTGMKSLLANMDKVSEGNATATENFNKLGISVQNADGSLRSEEEVLFETISAFQAMENSSEKSRLAQELFGKQGQEIIPLLNAESGSLEEMRQQANDLGLVLSDDAIDAGVNFTDTLDQMQRSLGTVATEVGVAVMPIIQQLLEWVIAHMPQIKEFVGNVISFIRAGINELMPIIKALAPVIEGVFNIVKPIWERVLKPVLTGILTFLDGVFSGNWRKIFQGLGEIVRTIFSTIVTFVKAPINAIITLLNKAIGGFNKIKIPSWVPGVGGKGLNIPSIPYLAKGGVIAESGTAVVGENGAELIEMNRGARVTPLNDNNNAFAGMQKQLEELQNGFNNLSNAMLSYKPQIVLDSGTLVGEIAPSIDNELGRMVRRNERGVIR